MCAIQEVGCSILDNVQHNSEYFQAVTCMPRGIFLPDDVALLPVFVNCWKLINLPKTNDYTYRLYNNKNTKHKAKLGFYLNSPQHDL